MVNDIRFFKEEIHFRLLDQAPLRRWIAAAVRHHHVQLNEINFIFCSDQYLLQLNKKFLNHHYFTDIITFDNSTEKNIISGDIYISYPRIKENSGFFKTSLKDELHRVMLHGTLHLLGYRDKSKKEKILMRAAEDLWLDKRKF